MRYLSSPKSPVSHFLPPQHPQMLTYLSLFQGCLLGCHGTAQQGIRESGLHENHQDTVWGQGLAPLPFSSAQMQCPRLQPSLQDGRLCFRASSSCCCLGTGFSTCLVLDGCLSIPASSSLTSSFYFSSFLYVCMYE